jgi:hypothetical protein
MHVLGTNQGEESHKKVTIHHPPIHQVSVSLQVRNINEESTTTRANLYPREGAESQAAPPRHPFFMVHGFTNVRRVFSSFIGQANNHRM